MPAPFTRPVSEWRRRSSDAGDSKADGTTDDEEPVAALTTCKLQTAIAHAKGRASPAAQCSMHSSTKNQRNIKHEIKLSAFAVVNMRTTGIAPSSTAVAQQHRIAYDAGRGVWHLLAEGSPDPGIPAAPKEQRVHSDASCASTQPASPQATADQTPAVLSRVDTDENLHEGYEGGASAPVSRQASAAVFDSAGGLPASAADAFATDSLPVIAVIAGDTVAGSSTAVNRAQDVGSMAVTDIAQALVSQLDEASTTQVPAIAVAMQIDSGTTIAATQPSEHSTAAAGTEAKCNGVASCDGHCVMWRGEAVAMPILTVTLWNQLSATDKEIAELERPLVAESKDKDCVISHFT
jgi:hypothetical protein